MMTEDAKHALFSSRLETAIEDDSKFKVLYRVVVDIFERQLKADLDLLGQHQAFIDQPVEARKPFLGNSSPFLFGLSYAAKWVPTAGKSADRQLHINSAIALALFPGVELYKARERLQSEVLAPLRAALKVPEVDMVAGPWKIDYTKVPSRAMARYGESFLEHDPAGFEEYINKVASGRYFMSAASLFPHEILLDGEFCSLPMTGKKLTRIAMSGKNKVLTALADLQWGSLVDSLRSSSTSSLQNCLAIADVSGSMGSLKGDKKNPSPLTVCIALTLLLGELAAAPWNGLFFTFTSDPATVYIDPSRPLSERAARLQRAKWGMSTNFYKVFDMILAAATREKLAPGAMVKKLFVFSDMQFDAAIERHEGDTEYTAIKRKFADAGYTLPELVFWNLGAAGESGTPKPVKANEQGVSLLSGYSGALMKFFLGEEDARMKKEDEELVQAMESEWEMVSEEEMEIADLERLEGEPQPFLKRTRAAMKDNPLGTVMKILSAGSFRGVLLRD
jgi:hypothetical protein